MSAPVINSIVSVAQGTGSHVKQSVIEVVVNFSLSSATADFTVELSLDNGTTWYKTAMNSVATGQGISQSTTALMLVDVRNTMILNTLVNNSTGSLAEGYATATIRLRAENTSTSEVSSDSTSSTFSLKTKRPEVTSVSMNAYVGVTPLATPYTVIAQDFDSSNAPIVPAFYKSGLAINDIQLNGTSSWNTWTSITTTQTTNFNFGSEPEGTGKTIYVEVFDIYYNTSDPGSTTTYLQKTAPQNGVIQVVGSTGNASYTGILIGSDGSFSPDRSVQIHVSATSPIPMTFTIRSTSDMEPTVLGGSPQVSTALDSQITYQELDGFGNMTVLPNNLVQTGNVTVTKGNPSADNFNTDASTNIYVRFVDAAGNTTDISYTIRLNTRVYQTSFKPMWPADSTYQPILKYVNSGGAEVLVPKSMVLSNQVVRAWPDIFFPLTHGYPLDPQTGTIDESVVLADSNLSNMISTEAYDAVVIDTVSSIKSVHYDSDGRPVEAAWTVDGSKNYPSMLSSNVSNLQYWVIDNQSYGDFQLEFEEFDIDTGIYGPPYNPQAPYRGDVLTIYDATAVGALTLTTNNSGNQVWILNDPTKLVEIASYTGNSVNVVNLTTGARMNSGQNGNFITDWIRNTQQICVIIYSDANANRSGFKIKSGDSHQVVWYNYDTDEANGRVWVHMHSSISNTGIMGAADSTTKRLQYDYMDEEIVRDYEAGTITFGSDQSANVVTADYSYYASDTPQSNLFLASWHDFVAYDEVATFAMPSGVALPNAGIKGSIYETAGYGRLMQNVTWDTDRGVLTVDPSVADTLVAQRLFADYYHHTFLRLTSDGYGDLTWRDKVIVADSTPIYPDYTFQDVKIVNEGDALLEQMQVKFVARGYDTNNDGQVILQGVNVVDQVLDINRPWDIQMGTKAETYLVMAMAINYSYVFTSSLIKSGGTGFTGDSGATSILGAWLNNVFGNVPARSSCYGRAVWVLGGTNGSTYPVTTSGVKRTSLEASGRYYSTIIT